jgi:hypothetical protein
VARVVKFAFAVPADVTPERALTAYGSPGFYRNGAGRSDISVREVVGREMRGDTVAIEVRFAFTGDLSSAVRAVVDPDRLTWVTSTVIEPGDARAAWVVRPDHYPDRLSARGTYVFGPGDDGPGSTVLDVEGDLEVRVPFVGGSVERAIVSGLRDYLDDQVASLPDWNG